MRGYRLEGSPTDVIAGMVVEVDALVQVGGRANDHEAMQHQRVVQVDEESYLHVERDRRYVELLQLRRRRLSYHTLSTSGSCQHQGLVDIKVLSTSRSCRHQGLVDIRVLSTSGSCQHQGLVNIRVLSTSGCCQHQGLVNIRVLSTSGSCRHQGLANIKIFPTSRSCRHQGLANIKVLSTSRSSLLAPNHSFLTWKSMKLSDTARLS
eukprot:7895672-Pyramimonas_sp.AAC.1